MLRQPKPDQPSKLQVKYRVKPLQVMKVLPGDTYRVAEVARDGRKIYATTAHVSQPMSWKIFLEDENDVPPESETEDENAVLDPVRAVRHEVEEENGVTTTKPRPVRMRRPPAHLSDYRRALSLASGMLQATETPDNLTRVTILITSLNIVVEDTLSSVL
ncbi:hypothetical protein QTP88_010408 [Uroleucon formosanum]